MLQSVDLGTHLSSLLDQYQQYQVEATALDSWLNAQEQSQSILKPSGEQTDTQALQNTLKTVHVRVPMLPKLKMSRLESVSEKNFLSIILLNVFFFAGFKHLQDELAERMVQLEKLRNSGKVLTSIQESPKLKTADVKTTTGDSISIFCLLH